MSHRKLVAIHQPNFFPWLGYFDKIARADIFLVMDNAQFPKSGKGCWGNRVKLLVNGQPAWVTAPVDRSYQGVISFAEMKYDDSRWRDKTLRTIQMSYSKAPFFKQVFPFITELVNYPSNNLAEYNFNAIRAIMGAIGLNTDKLVLGSTLNAEGNATDLLISMVKAVDGTAYLCGGGADGYQEDEKFAAAGLELVYQSFSHPTYSQKGSVEFIPGLSIIDALMNLGFDAPISHSRSG